MMAAARPETNRQEPEATLRFVLTTVSLIMLAGCGTRQVGLAYSPPAPSAIPAGGRDPVVGVGTVVDDRHNGLHWFGAIRDGYGNPIKIQETEEPVKDVAAHAFSDALAARGMLAPADNLVGSMLAVDTGVFGSIGFGWSPQMSWTMRSTKQLINRPTEPPPPG